MITFTSLVENKSAGIVILASTTVRLNYFLLLKLHYIANTPRHYWWQSVCDRLLGSHGISLTQNSPTAYPKALT